MFWAEAKAFITEVLNHYFPTKWIDHEPTIGQIGTPLNAENFNHVEGGVHSNSLNIAVLRQELLQQQRISQDMELEMGTITLSNGKMWPFNNSEQIVVFQKEKKSLNYRVHVEVLGEVPNVGEIRVYGKQLNGFKLAYTGSAPSVRFQYFAQGGFVL